MDIIWSLTWQSAAIFVISTSLFDVLHFLLHRWRHSRFALLRMFASWHQVHHDFLDRNMDVHPELKRKNLWAHLVPEYVTSMAGTLALLIVFPLAPVVIICLIHTVLFAIRIRTEGLDTHHMAMDRVSGQRGTWLVTPSYHAMHHIDPLAFYSSFLSLFDIIFGTALELRGKCISVTGATGALGSEFVRQLERAGATVTPIGRDLIVDFEQTDILVLAHGSRGDDVWEANYASFVKLGDALIEAGRGRLVPPELWAVGSEAELLGWDDYAMSKRQFADYAATHWCRSPDVTYRHIVPAAFKSKMGWGPMSTRFTAAAVLFLVRRGLTYVPVTWSGLALLNWLRFVWRPSPLTVAPRASKT